MKLFKTKPHVNHMFTLPSDLHHLIACNLDINSIANLRLVIKDLILPNKWLYEQRHHNCSYMAVALSLNRDMMRGLKDEDEFKYWEEKIGNYEFVSRMQSAANQIGNIAYWNPEYKQLSPYSIAEFSHSGVSVDLIMNSLMEIRSTSSPFFFAEVLRNVMQASILNKYIFLLDKCNDMIVQYSIDLDSSHVCEIITAITYTTNMSALLVISRNIDNNTFSLPVFRTALFDFIHMRPYSIKQWELLCMVYNHPKHDIECLLRLDSVFEQIPLLLYEVTTEYGWPVSVNPNEVLTIALNTYPCTFSTFKQHYIRVFMNSLPIHMMTSQVACLSPPLMEQWKTGTNGKLSSINPSQFILLSPHDLSLLVTNDHIKYVFQSNNSTYGLKKFGKAVVQCSCLSKTFHLINCCNDEQRNILIDAIFANFKLVFVPVTEYVRTQRTRFAIQMIETYLKWQPNWANDAAVAGYDIFIEWAMARHNFHIPKNVKKMASYSEFLIRTYSYLLKKGYPLPERINRPVGESRFRWIKALAKQGFLYHLKDKLYIKLIVPELTELIEETGPPRLMLY